MTDRNFDPLAERFARRVYGGLKGEIRLAVLWRDIEKHVVAQENLGRQLTILDVGGGLGQLAIRLAQRGHRVVFNDLSATMLQKARQAAAEQRLETQIEWHIGPYQDYCRRNNETFDIILSHALLEWLEKPQYLVPTLSARLASQGLLSLCFYNPAAKIYRNLIRGNFDWLKQQHDYLSDAGSLTPNNPCSRDQVCTWLADQDLTITLESGIRVFHDYVVEKRGGHQSPEDVLSMELEYSRQAPFKSLGRYLHIMAQK